MLNTADRVGFPHRKEITAIVLAILPLIISVGGKVTVNNVVTSYSDFADVVLGAALAFVTFNNLVFINEGEAKYKLIRIALTVVLFALAAFYILSGLGMLVSLPYPLGFGR